ncbi:MAG: FkbM family methyltransferase [Terriglobales bacterium]
MMDSDPRSDDHRAGLRRGVAALLRHAPLPGQFQAYRLAQRLLGDQPLPFIIRLRGGGWMRVESDALRCIYYLGDFEGNVGHFLRAHCRPGETVVDVGANAGVYTVALAQRVGPQGRVLALEALRANFESLERNVALNGFTQVECIFGAVAERAGELVAPDRPAGNYSLASPSAATTTIPARTLDDLTAGFETIHLMKMDIEGSETQALRGAERLFRERRVRCTVIEFNPYWLQKMGSSAEELYELFMAYGLEVRRLSRSGRPAPATRTHLLGLKAQRWEDLVLRPRDAGADDR